jgi:hypothetical protein
MKRRTQRNRCSTVANCRLRDNCWLRQPSSIWSTCSSAGGCIEDPEDPVYIPWISDSSDESLRVFPQVTAASQPTGASSVSVPQTRQSAPRQPGADRRSCMKAMSWSRL